MSFIFLLMLLVEAQADITTRSYKELLQSYLSSAIGACQVEALRREFKSFADVIEKSTDDFKEKTEADFKKKQDILISTFGKSSVAYTRWGKKTCPSDAELVYSGYVGGSRYDNPGAVVNPLCLARDPEWGVYQDGVSEYKSYIYGAEYETAGSSMGSVHNYDVPCAVCLTQNRSVVEMFPARKTCYKGWILDYTGYLMAGYYKHKAGTTYTCFDSVPDTINGSGVNMDGYLLYQVEARCGSLKCPPYVEGREVVCAVCSKQ